MTRSKILGLSPVARKRIGIVEKLVADHYLIGQDDLYSRSRSREIAGARFMLYYMLNKYMGLSSIRIGSIYGYDHTTVIYGIRIISTIVDQTSKTVDKLWANCEKALDSCGQER